MGPFDCIEDVRQYYDAEPDNENMWIMELDVPAGDPDPYPDYDDQGNLKPGVDHG